MSHYSDETDSYKHRGDFKELEFIEQLKSFEFSIPYHKGGNKELHKLNVSANKKHYIIYMKYFKPEDPPSLAKLHRDELSGVSYARVSQIKRKIGRMMRHPYWYKAKEE